MGKRLALIIGNSIYRDPTLSRLKAPEADVGALAEILLDPDIGGFDDANVLMNVSSSSVRRAITDFFSKKSRDDLLLLYFTGHGVLDERGRLYLAVKDTEPGLLRGTAIPANYITDEMDNSYSQRQVLVLDCCHSGAFARGTKGSAGASVGTAAVFEGTGFGRIVLTATDATQYAWEGDQVIGDAQNSLFTHFIVEGLQSGDADLNKDGQISVDELFDYVYQHVVKSTPKQIPGKWSFREQGEIAIARALQHNLDVTGSGIFQPKPSSSINDEEDLQKLERLYTKGLSAYWLEEWEQSESYFSNLVAINPNYKDAAAKLDEVKRQRRLGALYTKAQDANKAEKYKEAIQFLEELVGEGASYKDAAALLETTRRAQNLADLYDQARQLYHAGQWQALINIFEHIRQIHPNYPDPENLLTRAKQEQAALQRRNDLDNQYKAAMQQMGSGNWQTAYDLLQKILEKEPEFEDAPRLLKRVENELSRIEKVQKDKQESVHGQVENTPQNQISAPISTPALPAVNEGKKISRRTFFWLTSGLAASAVMTWLYTSTRTPPVTPTPPPYPTETSPVPALEPTLDATSEATLEPSQIPEPKQVSLLNTTWPLGDVPRNRTLNWFSYVSTVFNPFSNSYQEAGGSAALYEPCAYYSPFTDKITMWLAESYNSNEDATVWEINFRKGIKWSDGTPFTANDVAAGLTRLARVTDIRNGSTYRNNLASAEAADDLTLRVDLKTSDPRFFLKYLTLSLAQGHVNVVQPDHVYSKISDENLANENVYDMAKGWPVSTGPYGVGISTDTVTNYDLRPSWWAVETGFVDKYPDIVRLRQTQISNNNDAVQKLIDNDIDLSTEMSPQLVAGLLSQAGNHVTTWTGDKPPYGCVDNWPLSLWFNCSTSPWDNSDVRWAVSYAIDRRAIIDQAYGGAGIVSNSIFPEFKLFNDYMAGIKDLTDQYDVVEFNLDKSKSLMIQAGYKQNNDGLWADANGVVLTADLYASELTFGDLPPAIAQQLRRAGFSCDQKNPDDVWAAMMDGRANLFIFGNSSGIFDPYDTFQSYRKANILPAGQQSWGNPARWSNDDLETLMNQMNFAFGNAPIMKDLFHRMMEIFYKNLPSAPLVQYLLRVPVNTTYWTNWPDEENPYTSLAFWHKSSAMLIYNLKATLAA